MLADGWGGALNLPRRATQPERRALRGIRADDGIVYLNEGIARRGVRVIDESGDVVDRPGGQAERDRAVQELLHGHGARELRYALIQELDGIGAEGGVLKHRIHDERVLRPLRECLPLFGQHD